MQNVIFVQRQGQEDDDFQKQVNGWLCKMRNATVRYVDIAMRGPLMIRTIFYELRGE